MGHRFFMVGVVALAAISFTLAVACDDDEDGEPTATAGAEESPAATSETPAEGASIDVTLTEFSITAGEAAAAPGAVSFNIENAGGEEHEFMVAKLDAAGAELPVLEDGSVDEAQADIVDEIEAEELQPGDTATLDVDLEAGSYVLLCNLVEEMTSGEPESHYAEGMHTDFTVE
jgi:uncharacterized cupredoxin-like copper-binding protein